MTKKRTPNYPAARNARRTPPADGGPSQPRTSIEIDVRAATGRPGLAIGARVRIAGSGLYAGETAVIERFTGSVVPSAVVRTESGGRRQVRTIDLEPVARV